jgi:hypothetical protein
MYFLRLVGIQVYVCFDDKQPQHFMITCMIFPFLVGAQVAALSRFACARVTPDELMIMVA